jgi:hypothetical protein
MDWQRPTHLPSGDVLFGELIGEESENLMTASPLNKYELTSILLSRLRCSLQSDGKDLRPSQDGQRGLTVRD